MTAAEPVAGTGDDGDAIVEADGRHLSLSARSGEREGPSP